MLKRTKPIRHPRPDQPPPPVIRPLFWENIPIIPEFVLDNVPQMPGLENPICPR